MFDSYSTSIKKLLEKKTHPELAALYSDEMEVQVNVAADDGERIGDYKGHKGCSYTDHTTTWYPIRIPKDGTEDNSNKPMVYDLFAHAEGIGMTGWNWKKKQSIYFGFDFDAIIGHSEKHKKKMTDAELQEVSERAKNIPWVTVRKSTGGSGYHLYVFLNTPIETQNHTEHAALGRAILGMMSALAGFDFSVKVDVCGGNMWVWHRKMKRADGTLGLTLVRAGERLDSSLVPKNWRDHVKVVSGSRKKIVPEFIQEEEVDLFEEMSGKVTSVKLDDQHKALLEFLQKNNLAGWWDPDHRMLVTHTAHLERAHKELGFTGIFKTNSDRTNLDEQNCFAFPLRRGGWAVRRYSPGCEEDPTWEQDGVGYTKCYLNREPTLFTASKARGGVEDEQGAYRFKTAGEAAKVAKELGSNLELPVELELREGKLKTHKDGNRLIIEVPATDQDQQPNGWYNEKGKWRKVLNVPKAPGEEYEAAAFDEVVRHAVTDSKQDAGWYVKVNNGWHSEPLVHVTKALQSLGKKPSDVNGIIGSSVRKPWTIVSIPFAEEYPGDRQWNLNAVQYMHPRNQVGEFPNWTKMLNHIGKGLDLALSHNPWAIANNIKTGGEYLKLWLASPLQNPYKPTPYIFLWSAKNNTGKSTFHNALDFLISPKGIKSANVMLEQKDGKNFNAEIVGAVFCTIEELDLRKRKDVYNKIKDLVTSPKIMIHPKGATPFEMPNTAHFVHCANDHEACPIFPGDTRITMITVPEFEPGEHIPKDEFMELLRKEAPYFLNELLTIEIPPSKDRLAVPVVDTAEKNQAAEQNKNDLEQFLEISCHQINGESLLFSEFFDAFQESLDNRAKENWSKIRVSKNMPPQFPIGLIRGTGTSNKYIGNLSLQPGSSTKNPFVKVDKNYLEIAR